MTAVNVRPSWPPLFFLSATPEPGEDPRVTRAKFFIRDEFLVRAPVCQCPRVLPVLFVFGQSLICRPSILLFRVFEPQSFTFKLVSLKILSQICQSCQTGWKVFGTWRKISICVSCSVPLTSVPLVPLSGSALRAAMADTTAIRTSPVLWTRRTSDGCSTTAGTSSRECTCGSTNSCDGRQQRSSALCFSPPFYVLEELFLFFLLLLLNPFATPRPSCQRRWSTTEECQILVSSSLYIQFFPPFHCQQRKVGEQSDLLIWNSSSFNSSFLKALNFVIPLSLGLPPFMPLYILLSSVFSLDVIWWVQDPSVEVVCVCVSEREGRVPFELA